MFKSASNSANTDADTVVVRIGAKERGGITKEVSLQLWDLYRDSDPDPLSKKLTIDLAFMGSPVRDVYDFVEKIAPEGSTIYLAKGEININQKVDVRMYNSLGDMIILENDINVLDVSYLTPGVYMIQLTYKNRVINRKIIKE